MYRYIMMWCTGTWVRCWLICFGVFQYRYLGLMYRYIGFSVDDVSVHGESMYRYMHKFWLTFPSAPLFLNVSVHAGDVLVHSDLLFMYRACTGRAGIRQGFGKGCTGTCKTCTDTCQFRNLQLCLWCFKTPRELTYRSLLFPARLGYLLYLHLPFLWSLREHFTSFNL